MHRRAWTRGASVRFLREVFEVGCCAVWLRLGGRGGDTDEVWGWARVLRVAWRQIRARGSRTAALALAIVIAAAGFTVLTASARASRLETVGEVQAHARSVYDILVRPRGGRSAVESSQGLVQPGFLTGVYGGITMGQWRRVESISGVDVAAPVAMVGYVYPALQVAVPLVRAWPSTGDAVARVDVTWRGDNGLTVNQARPDFGFVTSRALEFNVGNAVHDGPVESAGVWKYAGADGREHDVCNAAIPTDLRPETRSATLTCFSRTSGGSSSAEDLPANRGLEGIWLTYPLAYVVAAVDPSSEERLLGLDEAVTSGSSLEDAPLTMSSSIDGNGVPVLVAEDIPTEETATITVSRVGGAAAHAVVGHAQGDGLVAYPHRVVSSRTVSASQAHRLLLRAFRTATPITGLRERRGLPGEVNQLAQVDQPVVSGDPLRVALTRPARPDAAHLLRDLQYRAPDSTDRAARTVTTSYRSGDTAGTNAFPATLYLRGVFDPAKLTGLSDLTGQILSGYSTAPTSGADERTRALLGHQPLHPSTNLTGFVQPPPMMLTTLQALPQLQFGGWAPSTGAAPISAIRVRVAGVTGVDPASRERVRLVAQRIQAATGLDVDVTVGASPTARTLVLPAGSHGRPKLTLTQQWLKKGVAVAILQAVDKKSLALFALVLLVSALSVANSAVASVRGRRTELGVLACLGWKRRHLFGIVVLELGTVALAAGAAASLIAYGLGSLAGTPVSVGRALLAIPAALVVAGAAGVGPAWMATKADPMAAVQPAVDAPRRASRLRGVTALGLANLTRHHARTALAALGVLVGVAAFTVLLAITLGFQGAVVGTLLGDAVAVQARGADYAAVLSIMVLAALGVANVLYLNIRDRGPELATLRALGWQRRHIDRMVLAEGIGISILGALPGAVLGLLTAWTLTHTMNTTVIAAAAIALAIAVITAAAAAVVSTRLIRRLPTTLLLTE